jgi:hypothetical protein
VADVNGDGKPDIVTGNPIKSTVSVLLGNGDGTFQPQQTFPVGSPFSSLAVADVNGDGKPDIVTATPGTYSVTVLLGNGDGTFQAPETFPAGSQPRAVAVKDVNGDGKPDIITANQDYTGALSVSVLLGKGDGTFQPPDILTLGQKSNFGGTSVAVVDLNGDRKPDIVFTNPGLTTGDVFLGNGDGTFQPPHTFPVGPGPGRATVTDLNGDGKPDIVTVNADDATMSVLLGNDDGTFQPPRTFPVGPFFGPMAVTDFNGDGKPDLAVVRHSTVTMLLGNGDGSFTPLAPGSGVGSRNTPYLADFTGNDFPDSVVLDRTGNLLFRKGLPGADNPFAPPIILNRGRPGRDLAVLHTATGLALASADASFDPTLSGPNHFVYTVSLYRVAADGTVHRTTAFSTTRLPTHLAAADLTGNGLDDLIAANSLDNSIQIAFQQPDGSFSAPLTLPTGQDPSDVRVADFNGDGLPDIAVSNQASGDVTVFLNDPQHSFLQSYGFRAGAGPYALDTSAATPAISTLEQSVSLAAGEFTGQGRNDLLVVNRGSDSFTVLPSDGQGGFANPQPVLTTSTSEGTKVNTQAGPVVTGHFRGPGQPLDLAFLMKDRAEVWIYSGNGDGTFTHTFTLPAGAQPTGLNLVHNSQTGFDDLLVGDPFGDVLHLQGKGDGTFQVAGRRTTLAAQNLGNGHTDVLVANQQSDRITIQAPQPGSTQITPVVTLTDGSHSTLAPGAVQWAKLDKNSPYYDAVVVASGANAVLVYRGTGFDASGNPTFAAPVSYAVGTNPVSVTIQNLFNSDGGIPDMIVANQGSNDVSILFGSWDSSGHWVGTAGPRLKSGGSGPIAAQAVFPAGGGLPHLVVTNGESGTLAILPGVGQGFFNDQNPQIINLPGNPVLTQGPTFGASGLGVVVTATGQLIGFNLNNLAGSVGVVFTPPVGEEVAAAQALADGHVVAVFSSGEVVDLAPSEGGLAVDSILVAQTGIPSEPSALAVLQGESGMQVLVTDAGGDQLFEFLLPGPVPAPLPVPPFGPLVEVTPASGELLTVVVTLTGGTGPVGVLATADGTPGEGVRVGESAVASEGGVVVGAASEGVSLPSWGLGLMVAVPAGSERVDAGVAGEEGGEGVRERLAEPDPPRPAEEGLDLEKQLRGLDLYQPTPNPDRPVPLSGRPEGRRSPTLIAQAPAAAAPAPEEGRLPRWWAEGAEVASAIAANLRLAASTDSVTDAVFVQASSWSAEGWRLLGLAGLALCRWPGCLSQSEGVAQPQERRKTGRIGDDTTGGRTRW